MNIIEKLFVGRNTLKYFNAIASQAIYSMANFSLSLYLIKTASVPDYAQYSIFISVILVSTVVLPAAVGVPFTLRAKDFKDKHAAADSYLFILMCTIFILYAVCIIIAEIASKEWNFAPQHEFYLFCALAALGASLREAALRIAYALGGQVWQLSSALVYGLIALSYIGLKFINIEANLTILFYLLIAANISSFLILAKGSGLALFHLDFSLYKAALRSMYSDGIVSSLISVSYAVRMQSPIFLASYYLGSDAVSLINASRTLVTPFFLAITPISQMALPKAVSLQHEPKELKRFIYGTNTIVVALITMYTACLICFYSPLSDALNLQRFPNFEKALTMWCLCSLFMSLRNIYTASLQAMKMQKNVLYWYIITFVAMMICITLYPSRLTPVLLIIGLSASELVLTLILHIILHKRIKIYFSAP